MTRVLILGGTGNFGGYIARSLAEDPNIALLIGSRSAERADKFARSLDAVQPAEGHAIDIYADIESAIRRISADIVIHTIGPFQRQDYRVARAAIAAGAHYLDLADARKFVATIGELDSSARQAGVAVISGASSVPCLTAAFLDHYKPHFATLSSAYYGITAAQATNRGLGTASAILSYVGKSFNRQKNGERHRVYGWQGLHAIRYPELGVRLFGDCDVPDLSLFPERYPELHELRFVAGHEIKSLHLATWLLSWTVRLRLVRSLEPYADRLLRWSFLFDPLGTDRSGFHLRLEGTGHAGEPKRIEGFMVARQGHGPNIPCLPAVLIARRIAAGNPPAPGARPCLDLITIDQYLGALRGLDITTWVTGPGVGDRWPAEKQCQ